MKLKIISGGTATTTKLVNAETGEEVHGIQAITWTVSADDKLARAEVSFVHIPVEVIGETDEWAKRCYEDYRAGLWVASGSQAGDKLPEWDALPPECRAGWQAVAREIGRGA